MRTLLVLVLAAAAGGCGSDSAQRDGQDAAGGAPVVEDPGPVHVHGLGVNPRDGALFIATHTGLFRAAPGEERAARVAGRYQDTMGFTVAGPDEFLASGHPDGREKLPPFLGLIRSTDAGETWREVSLMGEVDFHVLETSGRYVYGFGSNYETRQPTFLVSANGGRDWQERSPPGSLVSLAISPRSPARVVAAAEDGRGHGLYASADGGRSWRPLGEQLGLLAWTPRRLFLLDFRGRLRGSPDGGRTWDAIGNLGGEPAAFDAADGALYAALHDGTVKRSADGGRTWSVRSRP